MKQLISWLALAGGVVCLSTSAIFVRLAQAPSGIIAFYRLFFALLFLIPTVIFSSARRKELKNLSPRRWIMSVGSGLLLSIHFVLWFESLRFTSVASSTVLVTLQPLFTIVLSVLFLRQKQTTLGLLGCAAALLGSVFIGWGDFQAGADALLGDLLALAAAFFISLYFFIGQFVRRDTSACVYTVLGYSGSVLFLLLYALVQGQAFTGYPEKTWLAFLGLALISTILGQFVFNLLLRWLPATSISMSILGEPVGTCILAALLLREHISLRQAVGMAVILLGLSVYFLAETRKSSPAAHLKNAPVERSLP